MNFKFVPHPDLDEITSTLNFDTADCRVVGSCDLYITKAAGSDKKLYKYVEKDIAAQYNSALKLSESVPSPQRPYAAASLLPFKISPFGPLTEISSRRTYAYLIATLSASHPDYDFSQNLRPADFKHERSLRAVIGNVNTTLSNLRPLAGSSSFLNVPGIPASNPYANGQTWGPHMWRLLDKHMTLKECSIYRYAPGDDPFDADDAGVWNLNYFFFNKERKRVCYFYIKGISILSLSPSAPPMTPIRGARSKRYWDEDEGSEGGIHTPEGEGARKRARYWLGNRDDIQVVDDDDEEILATLPSGQCLAEPATRDSSKSEEKDDTAIVISSTDEDEGEGDVKGKENLNLRRKMFRPLVDENDNYLLSDEDARSRSRTKSFSVGV